MRQLDIVPKYHNVPSQILEMQQVSYVTKIEVSLIYLVMGQI